MKLRSGLVSLALAAGFVTLYLSDLSSVPFHPDESSWVFMSRDFDALFLRGDLPEFAWQPDQDKTLQVEYRLLNAPLPKYLIGLGWWLAGFRAADLNEDWNWYVGWDENVQQEHIPAAELLWASRAPGAVLAALAAVMMYWIGRDTRGNAVGLLAALFSGLHALHLLHDRRAMAEGAAQFFAVLAVWVCLKFRARADRPGWLGAAAGVAVGLAVASKQTNLALLPVAMLAAVTPSWRATGRTWGLILAGSALTFWALNPILYRDPLGGAQAMISTRAEMAQRQAQVLPTAMLTPDPLARLQATLLELYLRPLAFDDVPVYAEPLRPQVTAYQAGLVQRLTGQPAVGVALLALTLAGIMFGGLRLWRTRALNAEAVSWAWGGAALGLTLLAIPFAWQRYFLPLLPPACLYAAFGLEAIAAPLAGLIRDRKGTR